MPLLRRKTMLLILYVISLFGIGSYLFAQTPPNPIATPELSAESAATASLVEFYGVVQSASRVAISINGQVIDLTSAQINTPITSGVWVRVSALLLEDGSFSALQIDPVPAGVAPGIVMMSGAITAVNAEARAFTLFNQTFDYTNTRLPGEVRIGAQVQVFAVADAPALWRVLGIVYLDQTPSASITSPNPMTTPDGQLSSPVLTPEVVFTPEISEDFEIVGAIEQVGSDFIVVAGQRIITTSANIEVRLAVGVVVEADVYMANGQIVAEEIKAANDSGDDDDNSGSGGGDDDDD